MIGVTNANVISILDAQDHNILVGRKDGAAELYFDNSKKFETINTGVSITGNVALPTTNRIYFGTSDTSFIQGEHGASAYLAFGANNEKMRLTRAGNLGIRTDNPQALLHLQGTGGNSQGIYFKNGTQDVVRQYFTDGNDNSDFVITYDGTGGAELTIHADGNLGLNEANGDDVMIGTATPQGESRLTIAKNHVGLGTAIALHNANGSGDGSKIISTKALVLAADYDANNSTAKSYLGFETDGTEKLRIDSSGRVLIGGSSNSASSHADELQIINTSAEGGLSIINGDSSMGHIYFGDTSGTAQGRIDYNHGGNYMRFYTADAERFRIDSNGDVGINETNPTQKLHVGGSIKLTAQLQQSTPADFWSQGNTFIELNGLGNLTHMGGYETNLTSNGYRDTNGQWVSYSANSQTGASQIGLTPTGNLIFRTDASKSNGTAHNPTERVRIDSNGRLSFAGDTDTYIWHPSANQLAITRGGASFPIVRIGTGGNGGTIGIGTDGNLVTGGEIISVRGYSSFKSVNSLYAALYTHNEQQGGGGICAHILLNVGGANRGGFGYDTDNSTLIMGNHNAISFRTGATNLNGTERLRIAAGGMLIKGHTASAGQIETQLNQQNQFHGNDRKGGIRITDFSDSAFSANLEFVKSRNATIGQNTILQNGDIIGSIYWGGANGTNFQPGAFLTVKTDGTVSSTSMPTAITFGTNAGNNIVERLRIASDGKVGINSTAPNERLDVFGTNGTIAVFGDSRADTFECIKIKNDVAGYPAITNDSTPDTLDLRSFGSVQATIDSNNNSGTAHFRVMTNGTGNSGTELFKVDDNGYVTKPANPMFKAIMSTSRTITSSGWHKIQFDNDTATDCFDVGSNFNTSNNRFTAPVTGYYHFGCNQRFDAGNGQYFRLVFYKNGSAGDGYKHGHSIYRDNDGFNYVSLNITGLIQLDANDYVEAWAYSHNDTSWTLQRESQFFGFLVG